MATTHLNLCQFLNLPAEIRQSVYKQIFEGSTITIDGLWFEPREEPSALMSIYRQSHLPLTWLETNHVTCWIKQQRSLSQMMLS